MVAGRCISAERRALASARITGTCMAMGQAAGTAAALAATQGCPMPAIDVAALQRLLKAQGAIFDGIGA
ncbi:FAD-dependent oxidoreductase [Microvirga sp. TS319]|uniref:FAD-dependent oxidoreductase n=1 Tax=Microvirga sp. TS319 TaxID=3241165 RepID=UPI003519DBDF